MVNIAQRKREANETGLCTRRNGKTMRTGRKPQANCANQKEVEIERANDDEKTSNKQGGDKDYASRLQPQSLQNKRAVNQNNRINLIQNLGRRKEAKQTSANHEGCYLSLIYQVVCGNEVKD